MKTDRVRLQERYDLARRDVEELDQQVEAGEIDEETAAGLRASYERELEEARRALEEGGYSPGPDPASGSDDVHLPAEVDDGDVEVAAVSHGRSVRRMVVGAVLVLAVATVAIFLAARGSSPDETAAPAGDGSPGALTIDPSTVTDEQLEAVVAANPGINGMRMALADRYFTEGNYSKALEHYLVIAENNPTPTEESEATARIGWMAFLTNQAQAGADMAQRAIDLDAGNLEAKLFLGFIKLDGLNDPAGAVPLLEEVSALPDLPVELKAQVDEALARARSAAEQP